MSESRKTHEGELYSVKTKSFLLCGAIGCLLFICVALIAGVSRPNYNSLINPISSLSIGDLGWIQILNFIITGIFVLIFSHGLKKVYPSDKSKFHGPVLIRLVGIGLIGSGIFITDPILGYPANQPFLLRQFTIHGHLHNAFSLLVFICLPWACFAFRKRFISTGETGRAGYSAFSGFAMIATFIMASIGFMQIQVFVDFAGVFQRLSVAIGWTWMAFLSIYLVPTKPEL